MKRTRPGPHKAGTLHPGTADHARVHYPAIGAHGIIGDTHTACLVGIDGTIDWYCYPHFDDSPLFGALLDHERGGRFSIQPKGGSPLRQLYLPDSNVLLTRLFGPDGPIEVIDFIPVRAATVENDRAHWHGLVRQVRAVSAPVEVRLACEPTFDYAREAPRVLATEHGALFAGRDRTVELVAPVALELHQGGPGEAGATAEFLVGPDEPLWFILADPRQGDPLGRDPSSPRAMEHLLADTMRYWRTWVDRCTYRGRWRERVVRSALTLKLLTFSPTGALVAAATTSLPETIGGERNWDYRFMWIRDAAFTLRALFRLGFGDEGRAFFHWLTDRLREPGRDPPVQPLYGIDGREEIHEEILAHLDGYRGSRPVRIGNDAHRQRQLDVFGEILETVSDYARWFRLPVGLWKDLLPILDWLAEHWHEPDEGIWEVRGPPQHFVYSKVMCWVAFDRAIRLADEHGLDGDVARWKRERDEIRRRVLAEGVHPERQYFTQAFGSEALDAANLLIPLYGFLPPDDPRVRATVQATLDGLTTGDLVHRYKPGATDDGLNTPEGAFSLCFFWLVDNLLLQGDLDRAWLLYEKFLTYGNHLNLYAEQISPDAELLGNFPQAFTHIGIIYSALLLDNAITNRARPD